MTTGTEFIETVLGSIRRHTMLEGGEAVLVGVSGGADSVALLHALLGLRSRLGLTLSVLHVNHGLRAEADAEAAFVEALARRLGVPAAIERVRIAQGPGQSLEARARAARYAAFRRRVAELPAERVALGHTADDQAETVLMRLLEGAGPRGLAGIPPVRGVFIRPLIDVRRREVEAELERAGLSWVDDPSNRDLKFLRNRIRHDVLPFLASSYNPRISEALCRAGALARGLVRDLEEAARRELARLAGVEDGGLLFSRAALRHLPSGVRDEVLRQSLERLGERRPLRGWAQRALGHPLGAGSPAPVRLGGVWVEVSGDQLRLSCERAPTLTEARLPIPGLVTLPAARLTLDARQFDRPEAYQPPRDPWTVAFDRATLHGTLGVRGRRPGDRFRPFGGSGSKRLKAFLIDAKIPRWHRDRLPLLVAEGEIIWVVGLRRGAVAPVTPETRRIVEVKATPLDGSAGTGGTRFPLAAAPPRSKMWL